MIIKIKIKNDEDLLEENASLSLGWIEITDRAKEISLFKDNLCMVFLTTACLLEHINKLGNNPSIKVEWVGEDYGAVFTLSVKKERLFIEDKTASLIFKFNDFKLAVLEGVKNFLLLCIEVNPNIKSESAFIDLESVLKELE